MTDFLLESEKSKSKHCLQQETTTKKPHVLHVSGHCPIALGGRLFSPSVLLGLRCSEEQEETGTKENGLGEDVGCAEQLGPDRHLCLKAGRQAPLALGSKLCQVLLLQRTTGTRSFLPT